MRIPVRDVEPDAYVDSDLMTNIQWQARPAALGLQNMEDRLGALGGRLTIATSPGRGTAIDRRRGARGLLDAQPGSPHDHDPSANAPAVPIVARGAHDGDDLPHLGRVGRVAPSRSAPPGLLVDDDFDDQGGHRHHHPQGNRVQFAFRKLCTVGRLAPAAAGSP